MKDVNRDETKYEKKIGRPSSYTPELAAEICERMSEGESVLKICKEPGMPNQATVFRWLEAHKDFREQYARARELQAHFYFEKITQIAFDDKQDFFIDGETGKVISDHVRVARARVQIDALKWASAKLLPKVYGDRGDRHEQDEKPTAITISWQNDLLAEDGDRAAGSSRASQAARIQAAPVARRSLRAGLEHADVLVGHDQACCASR